MKRKRKHTQRKAGRKRRPSQSSRKFAPPRTVQEFFAMPERFQETWIGIANTVSKVRADRISVPKASREFGVDKRAVIRLGRYAAKSHDRLLRVVMVISKRRGLLEIATRDSRQASKAGK